MTRMVNLLSEGEEARDSWLAEAIEKKGMNLDALFFLSV